MFILYKITKLLLKKSMGTRLSQDFEICKIGQLAYEERSNWSAIRTLGLIEMIRANNRNIEV